MDAVAIVLALAVFALMFGLIRAMDRIWAARTSSGWWSRWWCSAIWSMRCCAGSGC